MNPSWKERKGVAVLLGLLALGVWGAVGYSVWLGLQGESPSLEASGEAFFMPAPDGVLVGRRARPVYSDDFQDPFSPQVRFVAEGQNSDGGGDLNVGRETALPAEDVEITWPEVQLMGVIGRTALLSTDGITQVVSVGEFVDDAQITEIRPSGIVLGTAERQRVLSMEGQRP